MKTSKVPPAPEALTRMPLCIRFKKGDLVSVQTTAAEAGVKELSVWIRGVAVARAGKALGGEKVEALGAILHETAKGSGEQICVRFRPSEYDAINKAALRDRALPTTWIRAVVVQAVRANGMVEPVKESVDEKEEPDASAGVASDVASQRVDVEDRPARKVRVVGKSRGKAAVRA